MTSGPCGNSAPHVTEISPRWGPSAVATYDWPMLLGIGRGLLLRHLAHGAGIVVVVALIAAIILVRIWPQIVAWIENRRH
jgi:hypothetical protein